jgi:hypothetical protein
VAFEVIFDPSELVLKSMMVEIAGDLGLACKRAGLMNLAVRAYLHGYVCYEANDAVHKTFGENAMTLWEAFHLGAARKAIMEAQSMERQVGMLRIDAKKAVSTVTQCDGCEQYIEGKKYKCSVCASATYCGAVCQRNHWPKHRATCKK